MKNITFEATTIRLNECNIFIPRIKAFFLANQINVKLIPQEGHIHSNLKKFYKAFSIAFKKLKLP